MNTKPESEAPADSGGRWAWTFAFTCAFADGITKQAAERRSPMKAMLILVAAVAACAQFGCTPNPNANTTVVEYAESEEQGPSLAIDATHDSVRAGVRLVLKYDQGSEGFVGTVENVTNESIAAVRVEVHLSNGTELGPTPREGLEPLQKRVVTLSAAGQTFETWKAHAESGKGDEHGHGGEGEGEHGSEGGGEHDEGVDVLESRGVGSL